MIIFETATELDMIALRTFGISAKNTDTPIGRFGTGLKYALAVLMRDGCEVAINAGAVNLTISSEKRDFRDEEFEFITAEPQSESAFDLGFTTLLGRDWELWQAFRELYSNTVDEGGEVYRGARLPQPMSGRTIIAVTGANFEEVYDDRETVILTDAPIWENEKVAIHEGPSKFMFYQGVRARVMERASVFRYNLKSYIELTEDRTIKYSFEADDRIRDALAECDDEEIVAKALTGGSGSLEGKLDYSYVSAPGETFSRVVSQQRSKDMESIPKSAAVAVARAAPPPDLAAIPAGLLSSERAGQLEEIATLLSKAGVDIVNSKIIYVGRLPGDVPSKVQNNRLYLAEPAFEDFETLTRQLVCGLSDLQGWIAESWLKDRLADAIGALAKEESA